MRTYVGSHVKRNMLFSAYLRVTHHIMPDKDSAGFIMMIATTSPLLVVHSVLTVTGLGRRARDLLLCM